MIDNPMITKQSPLEELIDRSMEQRDIMLQHKMYETARTFTDVAKFLYALKISADL